MALNKWDFELTDILLKSGATSMPKMSFKLEEANSRGESRFVASLRGDFYRAAAFLLQHGATKKTGLIIESIDGDPNIERLKWLVDHGFDIDERNEV